MSHALHLSDRPGAHVLVRTGRRVLRAVWLTCVLWLAGLSVAMAQAVTAPVAGLASGFADPPSGMPVPPDLAARGFVLHDLSSQQTLAMHQPDQAVPPASLVKLMTAYLVYQAVAAGQLRWDQSLPLSKAAWRAAVGSGARALASPDARLTVAELMRAMAVLGANDAALALAEGVAGSVEEFVARMNRQAQVMGLKATVFRNPDGQTVSGQTSTPRELAWLAVRLLSDHPQALEHYRQPSLVVGGVQHPTNNLLLRRDPSVDGLQVAYAERLGYAMAATSRRPAAGGERRLIAVLVGASSAQVRAIETQKLLNWGYSAFDVVRLYAAGQAVSTAPVWKGRDRTVALGRPQPIVVAVPKGQASRIQTTLTRQDPLLAPLAQWQTVGTLHIRLGTQPWLTLPLQTLEAVPGAGWLGRTWDAIRLGIQ
jgi:serine-type D-Ala-D-Ala carboxypeptidase (penicillin-binding protein 5/6)